MTDFVGRTLNDTLETMLVDYKQAYRVTRRDGQPTTVTRDYRPDRLNFEVEDGVIVRQFLG